MPKVLIIEDEPALLSSMARGVSKLPGIETLKASNIDDAAVILDSEVPSLVLSDIDLPKRPGIEILGELGSRNMRVPVVFISAYLKAYGAQIPPNANVETREKPISLQELRDIVTNKTGSDADDATPFSVADYLQIACIGKHSIEITVASGDKDLGFLIVANGEIWTAVDQQGNGTKAFQRLVGKAGTTVTCKKLKRKPGDRTLTGNLLYLLLELAQVEDESTMDLDINSLLDGFDDVPKQQESTGNADSTEAQKSPVEPAFDDAWETGMNALLEKNYETALEAFLRAQKLKPEDTRVEANLVRLKELGFTVDEDETKRD